MTEEASRRDCLERFRAAIEESVEPPQIPEVLDDGRVQQLLMDDAPPPPPAPSAAPVAYRGSGQAAGGGAAWMWIVGVVVLVLLVSAVAFLAWKLGRQQQQPPPPPDDEATIKNVIFRSDDEADEDDDEIVRTMTPDHDVPADIPPIPSVRGAQPHAPSAGSLRPSQTIRSSSEKDESGSDVDPLFQKLQP